MTKEQEAAFKVVDEICAEFSGNRKVRATIEASLQVIYDTLDPKTDRKKD